MNKPSPTGYLVRALRLPFVSASALPFIFGSLISRNNLRILPFFLGFLAVVATHLSCNLINDYADSKSGADWRDLRFYGFFGGSKLIQEGLLSERFYFLLSVFFLFIATICVILLALVLKSLTPVLAFAAILALGWSYSEKPLRLSYHVMGEVVIFLLFGPAVVMGAYFIQTQIFPDLKSFILSLPAGFLTAAILFSNEVPDYNTDKLGSKLNWVSVLGVEKSYILYLALVICAFASIAVNIMFGYLSNLAWFSFLAILLGFKAAGILKNCPAKEKMAESSKLTIAMQSIVIIALILGTIL